VTVMINSEPEHLKAALIGDHIGQSLSPAMHEAEGRAQGLAFEYLSIDTARTNLDLPAALRAARDQGCRGVNVTHPHKQTILPLLTSIEHGAHAIGAVNTVLFIIDEEYPDDIFNGNNTDVTGFGQALQHTIGAVDGQTMALFGAGGAGAAVASALCDAGVRHLLVTDIDAYRSTALVTRLQQGGCTAEALDTIDLAAVDGAVNCTPIGMTPNPGQVLDPTHLSRQAWVADCVYFPPETELVRNARAAGLTVMDGTCMALYQMAASFELFTGIAPDIMRMERTMTALLRGRA